MLDIGWTELLVIGALALIVVGPKDLPGMLRNVGRFVAKARGMARDFQSAMDDAARQADLSEVADLKKDVAKWSTMAGGNPAAIGKSLLDGDGDGDKKPAAPEPGSLDAADAAENAAWEAEQARKAAEEAEEKARAAALRAAEEQAAAEAAKLDAVNRSAAELEAEIAREERDEAAARPAPPAAGA